MAVDWAEAQHAVIGAALIDPRCVPEILAEMRPEDFSGPCQTAFNAIRQISAEQTPVDPVVLLSRLGQDYKGWIFELIDRTPTAANVKAYIRICKEQSRLRLLRDLGEQLAAAPSLDDARALLNKAAAVSLETSRNTTYTAQEMAADWINSINAREKPDYITTGIGCLDSEIHTVKGNYHVIAGFTGNGKSVLGLQIAWYMAQTRRVGYFSNEVTKPEVLDRIMTAASGVNAASIKSRELGDEEMKATGRAASEMFKANFAREEAAGMTVEDIRAKTLQKGYEVVFVDYLQNVLPPTSRNSDRFQGVGEVSRGLQAMAHALGVVVIAMSQLSRQRDDEDFRPVPPLSSLRESGQIEQDADAVIFVHEPMQRQYQRFAILDIAKNRSGRQNRFFIRFEAEHQRFVAPSVEEYAIWSEVMHKRRALKADELAELKAEMEARRAADQKRALENEAKKRYKAKADGGEQMQMEEAKT